MAIVMDMCSGEFEMRFASDDYHGDPALLSGRNPALNMPDAAQLVVAQAAVAAVTPSERHSVPVFLASMDIEVFLRTMNKHP